MKKFLPLALLCALLISCQMTIPFLGTPTQTPTATETLPPKPKRIVSSTPDLAPTPAATPAEYPAEGFGPSNFPADVDPLTGLGVQNPALLDRRPLIVKVSNLPRNVRPQWGLSLADHVYEYYTEEGTTRFAAVFYGQDASRVGPIRSARFVDDHLVSMYKANFAFGSADYRVRDRLFKQDYASRLVIETACPPMCRYEPKGANHLVTNTTDLTDYINKKKVKGGNSRQNLDGLMFKRQPFSNGAPADHVYVRYSAAIYNRWDYDQGTRKYLRFSDQADDLENGKNESYAPLMDRLTNQQISADNLLVIYVTHKYYSRTPEIVDIMLTGSGKATLFRNGQAFQVTWQRQALDTLIQLSGADGQPVPLKPGTTFIEIVGTSTKSDQNAADWRFTFQIP